MNLYVAGSPTLSRYTDGILKKGMHLLGIQTVAQVHEASHAIVQFHGSPDAALFDEGFLFADQGVLSV